LAEPWQNGPQEKGEALASIQGDHGMPFSILKQHRTFRLCAAAVLPNTSNLQKEVVSL